MYQGAEIDLAVFDDAIIKKDTVRVNLGAKLKW